MNGELNLEALTMAINEAKARNKEAREIIRKAKSKKIASKTTKVDLEPQTEDLDEKLERLKEDVPEEVDAPDAEYVAV